jgi:O-antigen/teichoic acid export membrane protein
MATVIEIPKRAITQATTTLIARAFERNDTTEIGTLYRKTAINQLIIGSLILIGLWANLTNMFAMMPKGELFANGASVVILVGIGKLIDMAFGPGSEIIGLSRYYWFNLVCVSALAVIVVISNWLLIPRFGIVGAACGSVFALLIYNSVKCFFIFHKLGIQPFTWTVAKVAAIALGVMLLNLVLPILANPILDAFYRSVLITLAFGFSIFATRSSEEINGIVLTMVREIKKRIQK